MKKLLALIVICMPLPGICAVSSVDELLIRREARDVKKHSFPESKSREISYNVNLKYPATALGDAAFGEMKKLGWSKCSADREGWDSYVDASKAGHERTVFQNNSFWFRDGTLLTISMRYYAGVTKDKHRVSAPDNSKQWVVVLEYKNPEVKERLKISCP